MIDEKKLIEEIEKEIDGVIVKDTYSRGKNAGLRKARILAEEQPKIGEWIPCIDRLPDESTEVVLVCLKNGAVSVAICTSGEFINMMIGASKDKFRYFPEHNPVIAWQPLPAPCEVKSDE